MNFTQWRAQFFNVAVQPPSTNQVIGQVHPGHPHGVPRIHQGLRPRGAQPHEVGFINANSAINARFEAGVDRSQFVVNNPTVSAPQVKGTILRAPVGSASSYATPSTYLLSHANPTGFPSKPNISGGTGGVNV